MIVQVYMYLCLEEPKVHVAVVEIVDRDESSVARQSKDASHLASRTS